MSKEMKSKLPKNKYTEKRLKENPKVSKNVLYNILKRAAQPVKT